MSLIDTNCICLLLFRERAAGLAPWRAPCCLILSQFEHFQIDDKKNRDMKNTLEKQGRPSSPLNHIHHTEYTHHVQMFACFLFVS